MAKSTELPEPSSDGAPSATPDEHRTEEDSGEQAIRLRAYEISQSVDSGTAEENWERALQELETQNS